MLPPEYSRIEIGRFTLSPRQRAKGVPFVRSRGRKRQRERCYGAPSGMSNRGPAGIAERITRLGQGYWLMLTTLSWAKRTKIVFPGGWP
jgi:hypothetical protein